MATAQTGSGHRESAVPVPGQLDFDNPLQLACAVSLNSIQLVYETYGQLNADHSNAILICPALTANHHAAGDHPTTGEPGWWNHYIGPGKPIDTRSFFVVCCNNLGGCAGTTGPASINPDTGKYWGNSFPPLRVRDWVDCQYRLMQALDISSWAAVIGSSLGGMQAMRWTLMYPEAVKHAVVIASAMKLTAQNIAFNEVARKAITADPDFCDGNYLQEGKKPINGLAIARMIGHLTYMTDYQLARKFGRDLRDGSFDLGIRDGVEFQVERYLHHQGRKFAKIFDANTYLLSTRILDYFDLARDYGNDPVAAMKLSKAKFLVISFSSDWRFLPIRSQEIVDALLNARRPVSYLNITVPFGHDAFLLPEPRFEKAMGDYLQFVLSEKNGSAA